MSHTGPVPAAALALTAFVCGAVAATTIQLGGRQDMPASALAPAATAPLGPLTGYPAEVVRVFDGDTFEARVQVWPGLEITTKIRLRGIDAPELKARCAEERVLAQSARDALTALLAQGRVGIRQVSLDKYGGRVVADASARGVEDVAETLMADGHVRRYHGGRRSGWCAGRPSQARAIGAQ